MYFDRMIKGRMKSYDAHRHNYEYGLKYLHINVAPIR
jgi:hypothetical protein